jgi:hypothetical protein
MESTSRTPYARAMHEMDQRACTGAAEIVQAHAWLLEGVPARAHRLLERARRKRLWRRLQSRAASLVAAELRHLRAALGGRYAGRQKQADGSWTVFAQDDAGEVVTVAVVSGVLPRSFSDPLHPVTRIHRPDLFRDKPNG